MNSNKIIQLFLSNRALKVNTENSLKQQTPFCGGPIILLPIFNFILNLYKFYSDSPRYSSNSLHWWHNVPFNRCQYKTIHSQITEINKHCKNWFSKWHLAIIPNKTSTILFNQYLTTRLPSIKINNINIVWLTQTKYLSCSMFEHGVERPLGGDWQQMTKQK